MSPRIEVTYRVSGVGHPERQRRTLEALGLRKLHQTVSHADNPSIRGMIHSIQHLVTYEQVEDGDQP